MASQPLAQFMDFTTYSMRMVCYLNRYEFMIDNILLILKRSLTSTALTAKELEEECNPLGALPEHIIKSLLHFENTPKGYRDLFQIVLVEIPVGKYFSQYLNDLTENHLLHGAELVKSLLEENSLTLIHQGVMRLYLEDFYYWTQELGGYTAETMGEILKTKADTLAINLVLNSFGTIYNDVTLCLYI